VLETTLMLVNRVLVYEVMQLPHNEILAEKRRKGHFNVRRDKMPRWWFYVKEEFYVHRKFLEGSHGWQSS
jgi:hypothetical protein